MTKADAKAKGGKGEPAVPEPVVELTEAQQVQLQVDNAALEVLLQIPN
jgi:hypothetical protein